MQRSFVCKRICAVLTQDAVKNVIINNICDKPTFSIALDYAFDTVNDFQNNNVILWKEMMTLPHNRFGIPKNFNSHESYIASIHGDLINARLTQFNEYLKTQIESVRPMYKNYAIEAVLRANYAILHKDKFKDVLIIK